MAAEIGQAIQWHGKHPYIAPPAIDNEPFKLWFERQQPAKHGGALKITFRQILQQELTDEAIASKAKGMIGEDWPEGWFVWGEDASGENIEYYQRSRWGDRHGCINSDVKVGQLVLIEEIRLAPLVSKNSQLRPGALVASRSCRKERKGAMPVPGPTMMTSFARSCGRAKPWAFWI